MSSIARNQNLAKLASTKDQSTAFRERGESLGVRLRRAFDAFKVAKLPSGRWVIVLAIACVVALSVSGYLSWVALTSSKVAGCGGGRIFNCAHVISSRWSLWFGIPVSVLASGLYATMGVALAVASHSRFTLKTRHIAWGIVTVLAMFAGVAAIWFISLQVLVLNHLCTYCLVAHACGLLTAEIVMRLKAIGENAKGLAIMIGLAGVSVLIAGQLLGKEPIPYRIETFDAPAVTPEVFEFEAPVMNDENSNKVSSVATSDMARTLVAAVVRPGLFLLGQVSSTSPQEKTPGPAATSNKTTPTSESAPNPEIERRFVSINGGAIKLDVAQWPLAGSQSAKYIFVEMFDYNCPHCRKTHAAIKDASKKLNGDVAVVVLPIPLNATCNNQIQVTDAKFVESCEVSKLAVAVWRLDAVKFTEFHNWMFSEANAPTYANAKAHAETMVDAQKLNAELATATPSQYIAKTVELYKRAGSGNVPKLIFPGTTVVGEFASGERLVEIIQQQIR